MSEIAVKPLEWYSIDAGDARYKSHRVFGEYLIVCDYNSTDARYCWFDEGQWRSFASLEEAKAAAQVDYEARIRSALVPIEPSPAEARDKLTSLELSRSAWKDSARINMHRANETEAKLAKALELLREAREFAEPYRVTGEPLVARIDAFFAEVVP